MFNNYRFGFLTVAFIAALILSTFGAVASADDSNKEAEKFFNAMSPEEFTDPDALDDFIRRFPDSDQARIAFAFRYSLLEKMPTIEGYNEFISKYPDKLQAQVAIQEVFKLYRYQNRVTGYYDFIKRYPDTQQAVVAMMRIQELMFEYVCKLDKEEEYDAFISAFPDAPQVEEAKKKALTKATEKEELIYNEFLKNNPNAGFNDKKGFASKWISPWELRMEEYYTIKQENPKKIQETAFQLEWIQLDRRGKVLQKVYSEVNEGRVAKCRRDYFLADTLLEIKKTLETNHDELLATLKEETKKICEHLNQLHLDNQQIVQKLTDGFNNLHEDMIKLHQDLSDIKGTLDKMDRHLEDINRSIVEGFKQTNENITKINNNIIKLNNTVQTGFEVQAQLQREQLAELRIQSSRLTDLSLIAERGYNQSGSLWESQYAAEQTTQMDRRFSATGSGSSMIAQYVGSLAGTASKFIPCVGPFIAPAVERITEHVVDNVAIPCVQELYADITNPNDRRSLSDKCLASAQKMGTQAIQQLGEALPVVWQEEKGNILHAAKILADKKGIPEDLSNAVLAAAGSDSLEEAIVPLADYCQIPPEALTFAAQYIY